MRVAEVFVYDEQQKNECPAGLLTEHDDGKFQFKYHEGYNGPDVSLTMKARTTVYEYRSFPPFFEGLLPEGGQLEALLKKTKLDRNDLFGQLVTVGNDLVGIVTVKEIRI